MRGLNTARRSPSFEGRFGRMFRAAPRASFGGTERESTENLAQLGLKMSARFDPPSDGPDAEESGIPALYTYFGQFVDHDVTFDPASSLQKQNDPDSLIDFRTPAFDLDSVYGRGPDDQPYLYDGDGAFILGDELHGGKAKAFDLPRNRANPARALIGDPRNDENVIVSQLQGLFLRFHNRLLRDTGLPFPEVQRLVRFHYQYVIVNDFLPRVVRRDVLDSLKSGGVYDKRELEFFHWRHDPFMPVEFSVAAYRFGHSMVRPGYRLNDKVLRPIFPVGSQDLSEGLTGFRAMNRDWAIDWGRFIDVEERPTTGGVVEKENRLQLAYRLDTSLANPLNDMPAGVAANPSSLARRNLERGFRLGLPSGQAVAAAMGIPTLDDAQILIGKAEDDPETPAPSIASLQGKAFANNCPLWTYVLAEAMTCKTPIAIPSKGHEVINTPQLGPVGGRIVAEVLLGLMFGDPNSFLRLDPHWTPAGNADYKLRDFVKYALGMKA